MRSMNENTPGLDALLLKQIKSCLMARGVEESEATTLAAAGLDEGRGVFLTAQSPTRGPTVAMNALKTWAFGL